ncbi:MAG TPA: hypothetical protein VMX97_02205 [Hyphomicrobiaceae bacterium]|nr:hypothetical protein [Hyphomicrobiaceae bacterium]
MSIQVDATCFSLLAHGYSLALLKASARAALTPGHMRGFHVDPSGCDMLGLDRTVSQFVSAQED